MSSATREETLDACKEAGDGYEVADSVPTWDFNREIYPPGEHPKFPNGVVGIRTDDDFWAVATLPYAYLETPLADLVKALWPDVTDPRFEPDSTMPAYYQENGFPDEVG